MKRCPKCQRLGIEPDPYAGTERCLWNDCLWVNEEKINLNNQKFKLNFKKFKGSIKIKKSIAA